MALFFAQQIEEHKSIEHHYYILFYVGWEGTKKNESKFFRTNSFLAA